MAEELDLLIGMADQIGQAVKQTAAVTSLEVADAIVLLKEWLPRCRVSYVLKA